MVQRYFVPSSEGRFDDNGQFVKYEDYAELLAAARTLIPALADDARFPNELITQLSDLEIL